MYIKIYRLYLWVARFMMVYFYPSSGISLPRGSNYSHFLMMNLCRQKSAYFHNYRHFWNSSHNSSNNKKTADKMLETGHAQWWYESLLYAKVPFGRLTFYYIDTKWSQRILQLNSFRNFPSGTVCSLVGDITSLCKWGQGSFNKFPAKMSRSVSETKMGVHCDLIWLEGINNANMPIFVDPLPKSAINRNSWICTYMRPMSKIDVREQTVKVWESW